MDQSENQFRAIQKIGEYFLSMSSNLRIYTIFINNHEIATNTIRYLIKTQHGFKLFIETQKNIPECNNIDIFSYMIAPLSRIPRYSLFFRVPENRAMELYQIPEAIPALQLFPHVVSQINSVAEFLNSSKRQIDTLQKLFEMNLPNPLDLLINPDRILLFDSDLHILKLKDNSMGKKIRTKAVYVFLFNDLLLITTKWNKILRPHGHLKEYGRLDITPSTMILIGNDIFVDDKYQPLKKELKDLQNYFLIKDSTIDFLFEVKPETRDIWVDNLNKITFH